MFDVQTRRAALQRPLYTAAVLLQTLPQLIVKPQEFGILALQSLFEEGRCWENKNEETVLQRYICGLIVWYISLCLYIYVYVWLFLYMSPSLTVCISIRQSVSIVFICLPLGLSKYLSVYLLYFPVNHKASPVVVWDVFYHHLIARLISIKAHYTVCKQWAMLL